MLGVPPCPYLVLVGFFQRLDFFFVLVVLGVEGINHLETGGESDDRMRTGSKALVNYFDIEIDGSTERSRARTET